MTLFNHLKVLAFLCLVSLSIGCSQDDPPSYSIATLHLQGRVTNGQEVIASTAGDVCIDMTYIDCADTSHRIECFAIHTDSAGKFKRTVSVTAGQSHCGGTAGFYSLGFFVELPGNAVRYISDDVITDYCLQGDGTLECVQTLALRFVPPQTPKSDLPSYLTELQIPVLVSPHLNLVHRAPLLQDRSSRKYRPKKRKVRDVTIHDVKKVLPKYLETQKEDLNQFLLAFGNNSSYGTSEGADTKVAPEKQGAALLKRWAGVDASKKYIEIAKSVKDHFPYGIPEVVREALIEQITNPESIQISKDLQHATIKVQLDFQEEPTYLDLKKGVRGEWKIDRIRGEIRTQEDLENESSEVNVESEAAASEAE